jgi:hypothetical protein
MALAPAMASRAPKNEPRQRAGAQGEQVSREEMLLSYLLCVLELTQLVLRHHLSMQVDIETFDFSSLTHSHSDKHVDDDQDDQGHHA